MHFANDTIDFPRLLGPRRRKLSVHWSIVRLEPFPDVSHGHVITMPDFGTIELGKVTIKHEDFKPETTIPRKTTVRLAMIDFHFGCAIDGGATTGTGSANGTTQP